MKQSSIKALLSFAILFSMTSCLKKNDMIGLDTSARSNIIEFANTGDNVATATSTYPRFTTDLGAVKSGDTVSFNVNVSYSGSNDAPTDITVNLALDTVMLKQFNAENGTNYVAPPAAIYSMPQSVVIKKGTRKTQVKVGIVNNNSFNFNVNYGLPLTISSSTGGIISANFGKAVYSFSARNTYDGIYMMDATAPMVDVLNAGITGWYPVKMHLITYSGNSVALYDGVPIYTKTYGHPIQSGGSGSYYGSFSPVFFFDKAGNITSVTNYYGQNSGGNKRSAVLDPTGINKITFKADGTVDHFEVSYIMTQSVSSPDLPRTYFHEKFTYLKSR
ncbi:MAG: DUF1735 domain-containing protein [Chitinophaga sp.]|uniref:DUF1735 domain-containing protein n=1 Tax=Chitinophaga sp. TaxID=1869181 RepID=UPI0025BC2878|nr:DUF1735 domain-containing protein [Chitinophaga sp.]MBV8253340.1 DUF1735 domain-containing protein [Chitinophaga sp.]